ncbi:MAG: two-component system response regulator [Gammaproteobacteria bacterium]|nr:two-component system response regulator [Gammaproteobacteria bacterium]MDJ0892886.1 two-component system response regulator [Gammaproteobacteria bacterium]
MEKAESQPTVLVVDDVPENIDVLAGILRPEYKVKVSLNGEKALNLARTSPAPDLILLDIMMPGIDGYEVCRQLKADLTTRRIPVIFVTAKGEVRDEALGFAVGGVDYITKPVSPPIVQARVRTHLALYDQTRALSGLVRQRTDELNDTRLQVIRRLGRAAEFKDNETGLHVIRMSHYSRLLGLVVGMGQDEADVLFNAAPMHDIGKIGIPDRILQKPGKLDAEEWEIMKQHAEIGARIIGQHDSILLETARIIALSHHEKWNGRGYPAGLEGEKIPLVGRIVAIADVFDALTSVRPYKRAWPVDEAIELLKKEAGEHFDPALIPKFLEILPEVIEIKDRYAEASVDDVSPNV